ncbi:MAG: ribonuclease HII [Alphaproteobacteria bacterium TMED62]|nr:MAG: ribonuclease HII [Alphaproteobacteria bacterium TMED62]|tara:strand:+ start:25536 stop:26105 length:570 start_codon:yes stop_codon:yes gene_type:complete
MLLKKTACGFDEVGKGAIAGPVVVASVSFYDYTKIPNGIKDSKKISPNKRLILDSKIKELADVGIGIVMPDEIDKIGITEATNLAAQKSILENLYFKKYLFDGYIKIKAKNVVENIIKGDENYVSIAAASIIAKVTRDNIMINKSILNKQYMWDKNKGYGTKEHLLAIKNYGISDFHRKTFKLKVFDDI